MAARASTSAKNAAVAGGLGWCEPLRARARGAARAGGPAARGVYRALCLIFLLRRFRRLMRFLRHLARICGGRGGACAGARRASQTRVGAGRGAGVCDPREGADKEKRNNGRSMLEQNP